MRFVAIIGALLLALWSAPVHAQGGTGLTPACGTNNSNNATNAFVTGCAAPIAFFALTHNHIFVGNSSNKPADVAMSGACTISDTGVMTCSTTGVTSVTCGATVITSTGTCPTIAVVKVQVFTSGGTYTPSTGLVYAQIECWGGGGGGGGTVSAAASAFGGSGGAGSYSKKIATAAAIGASQTVTIGAAGTAGTAGNNAGGAGGDTSVGSLCVGKGGGGGGGNNTPANAAGGSGGVAGTGDVTGVGEPGMNGPAQAAGPPTWPTIRGGSAVPVGAGGQNTATAANQTGTAATGRASGGGGGVSFSSGGTAAGGAGTAGYVVITEFTNQ